MTNNQLIPWAAFTLFILAVGLAMLIGLAPILEQLGPAISEGTIWVMGIFALLSTVLGLIAFKTPQGKLASVGGVILLFALLYITPLSRTISP